MNPEITSLIGALLVFVGACTMLLMLELRGNPREGTTHQRLTRAHRILGYLFVALFFLMLFLMLRKAGSYQEEFSPRAILHIVFASILIPLLIIKILIVRRFRRLGTHLFALGIVIFVTAFALNSITAGYYFLHRSDIQYVALSEGDTLVLDEEMGRLLVSQKCGKCHTLERVFRSFKSEERWTQSVNRMAVIDAPNIRDFDAKQMIHYLVKQQEIRKALQATTPDIAAETGRTLVGQKCTTCHTLDRVYEASKTQQEWAATLGRMVGYMGSPESLTPEEKDAISEFLANEEDE
ncbi:MAG: DUF6529 family protein [Candidatus Latescibacterota bacterium]